MERVAYGQFLVQLTEWAAQHPDVIGLVAVGSTASTERLPDEYSDHDLIVVTRPGTSDAMRDDRTWVPGYERIVVWHPESEHGRAVIFDDGHLVELAVLDDNDMKRVPVNAAALSSRAPPSRLCRTVALCLRISPSELSVSFPWRRWRHEGSIIRELAPSICSSECYRMMTVS